jgi:hypothetical protein
VVVDQLGSGVAHTVAGGQRCVHAPVGPGQRVARPREVDGVEERRQPDGEREPVAPAAAALDDDVGAEGVAARADLDGLEGLRHAAAGHGRRTDGLRQDARLVARRMDLHDPPRRPVHPHAEGAADEGDLLRPLLELGRVAPGACGGSLDDAVPRRRQRVDAPPAAARRLDQRVARPAERVRHQHPAGSARGARREGAAGGRQDVGAQPEAALVRELADVAAQPLALVVVVVLGGEQLAPGLVELPGGVDVPARVGAAESAREGGERLGRLQPLLGAPAEAAEEVAVLAEAHPVEDVGEAVAPLDRVGLGEVEQPAQGRRADVEVVAREEPLQRREHQLAPAHPVGARHQLEPLDDAGAVEPPRQVARQQPVDVLGPLVEVERAARRREEPGPVEPRPPDRRGPPPRGGRGCARSTGRRATRG